MERFDKNLPAREYSHKSYKDWIFRITDYMEQKAEWVEIALHMKKAKEILNPDGSLEIQKTVAGEAIAFLADETAVSVRLIQYNPHGLLKFVYTIKATEI